MILKSLEFHDMKTFCGMAGYTAEILGVGLRGEWCLAKLDANIGVDDWQTRHFEASKQWVREGERPVDGKFLFLGRHTIRQSSWEHKIAHFSLCNMKGSRWVIRTIWETFTEILIFKRTPRGSLQEQIVWNPVWAISNSATTQTLEIKLMPPHNHLWVELKCAN